LEGVARLYSDQAILNELESLVQDYPKAKQLAQGYRDLMDLRDQSGADEESLKKLRTAKEAWEKDLLQVDVES
jgi:GTP1/Obg family GTP-binding protein